jgi:hypothetical protein
MALALALGFSVEGARAEAPPVNEAFRPMAPSFAVNFGLIQPLLLGGANLEVDVRLGRFIAAYSHGWSLEAPVVGEMERQGVRLHLPFSSGFGVGVQHYFEGANSYVDVRFEGKVHRFEASYASVDGSIETKIADYSTYTLGGGVYWTWLPFADRMDALRGINFSTSMRYWVNVADTLPGSSREYSNTRTGQVESHEAANVGAANTPFVANISVGYVFQ